MSFHSPVCLTIVSKKLIYWCRGLSYKLMNINKNLKNPAKRTFQANIFVLITHQFF